MRLFGRILAAAALCVMLCGLAALEAEASGKIRLGVLEFQSKADGVTDRQAQIITDIFTRTLTSSNTISVFERVALQRIGEEQRLGMSGLVDESTAIEIGRIAGLQYILLGAVTELSEKASGGAGFLPVGGIIGSIGIGSGKHEARAMLDVRVIDVTTSEIRLSLSEYGHSSNASQGFSIGGMTFAESEFGGLQARAIADAASRLGHTIKETLGGEYTHVVAMNDKEFTIDAGSMMGVQEGTLYLVYAEGKAILDMRNNIIGMEKIPLAVLRVRDTAAAHSVCVLAPPSKGNLIRRGDKIEPITSQKAKGMKFAGGRPAASSGTFEQLFAGGGDAAASQPNVAPAAADTPAPALAPASQQAPQPTEQRTIDGLDPNQSTDPRVVQTYPISSGEANIMGVRHRSAASKYNNNRFKDAYADYSALADAYAGDYLAAYWAGMSAQSLKQRDDAISWLDKAIAINPNYQPAIEARGKIK